MAYEPPGYNAADVSFTEAGYTPPAWNDADFDFSPDIVLAVPCGLFGVVAQVPQLAGSWPIEAVVVGIMAASPTLAVGFETPPAELRIVGTSLTLAERLEVGGRFIRSIAPAPEAINPARIEVPAEVMRVIQAGSLASGVSLIQIPGAGMSLRGYPATVGQTFAVDALVLKFPGQEVGAFQGVHVPGAALRLSRESVGYALGPLSIPVARLVLLRHGGSPTTFFRPGAVRLGLVPKPPNYSWVASAFEDGQTIYRCYLDDLLMPVSSIQMRRRDGEPSYLAAVIPSADYDADEAAINARSGGTIVVKRGLRFPDGREQLEEIGRATLESMGGSKTATKGEFNLTGHRTLTNPAPKTVALTGASYRNITDGKRRYRCLPDNFLQPGDTVLINGEAFIVGAITYTIGTDSERMEISER